VRRRQKHCIYFRPRPWLAQQRASRRLSPRNSRDDPSRQISALRRISPRFLAHYKSTSPLQQLLDPRHPHPLLRKAEAPRSAEAKCRSSSRPVCPRRIRRGRINVLTALAQLRVKPSPSRWNPPTPSTMSNPRSKASTSHPYIHKHRLTFHHRQGGHPT
jgi:hypothetical protein